MMMNRSRKNLYVSPGISNEFKTYTDDELKLLYAIDPYGVAHYISVYAHQYEPKDNRDIVRYKDEKFEMLFERKPKYYAHSTEGFWYETNNREISDYIVSESEILFGYHPMYLGDFTYDLLCFIFNISDATINLLLKKNPLKVYSTFIFLVETVMAIETGDYKEYLQSIADDRLSDAILGKIEKIKNFNLGFCHLRYLHFWVIKKWLKI